MFESMGTALGFFDEFAISYAGRRPGLGEMVGIELDEAVMLRSHASYDMFTVFATLFESVYLSAVLGKHGDEMKIAYSTSAGSGFGRECDAVVNYGIKT